MFNINSNGEITTTVLLDRENNSSFMLLVEAVDMGMPRQTCSATINITVEDANDNMPSFVNCEGPHLVTEVCHRDIHTWLMFKPPMYFIIRMLYLGLKFWTLMQMMMILEKMRD